MSTYAWTVTYAATAPKRLHNVVVASGSAKTKATSTRDMHAAMDKYQEDAKAAGQKVYALTGVSVPAKSDKAPDYASLKRDADGDLTRVNNGQVFKVSNCCGAYPTISQDDGHLVCRRCYRDVPDRLNSPATRLQINLPRAAAAPVKATPAPAADTARTFVLRVHGEYILASTDMEVVNTGSLRDAKTFANLAAAKRWGRKFDLGEVDNKPVVIFEVTKVNGRSKVTVAGYVVDAN